VSLARPIASDSRVWSVPAARMPVPRISRVSLSTVRRVWHSPAVGSTTTWPGRASSAPATSRAKARSARCGSGGRLVDHALDDVVDRLDEPLVGGGGRARRLVSHLGQPSDRRSEDVGLAAEPREEGRWRGEVHVAARPGGGLGVGETAEFVEGERQEGAAHRVGPVLGGEPGSGGLEAVAPDLGVVDVDLAAVRLVAEHPVEQLVEPVEVGTSAVAPGHPGEVGVPAPIGPELGGARLAQPRADA
jgi:hypothetical protein